MEELSKLFGDLRTSACSIKEVPAVLAGSLADPTVDLNQISGADLIHGYQQWVTNEDVHEVIEAEIDEILEEIEAGDEVVVDDSDGDDDLFEIATTATTGTTATALASSIQSVSSISRGSTVCFNSRPIPY